MATPDAAALEKKFHALPGKLCPAVLACQSQLDSSYANCTTRGGLTMTRPEFNAFMDNFCIGMQQIYNKDPYTLNAVMFTGSIVVEDSSGKPVSEKIAYVHKDRTIYISTDLLKEYKRVQDLKGACSTEHVRNVPPDVGALALGIEEASHAAYMQTPELQREFAVRAATRQHVISSNTTDQQMRYHSLAEQYAGEDVRRILAQMEADKTGPFAAQVPHRQ